MMATTTSRYPSWLMKLAAPPNSADDEVREQLLVSRDQPIIGSSFNKSYSINVDDTHSKEIGYHDEVRTAPLEPQMLARHPSLTQAQRNENDSRLIGKLFRRLLVEGLGTFVLVWVIAVAAIEFSLRNKGTERGPAALSQGAGGLIAGLTLAFLIWSMGHVSGGHFNPVVTWAFALRGMFPWRWVLPYWIAQIVGSLLAGGFVRAFYYKEASMGTTAVASQYNLVTGMFYEAVLTFIFVFVVLAMASKGGNVNVSAALSDGFALAVVNMIGWSYTGVAVNPARAVGPGLVNGPRDALWVYVAGPFIGATCSAIAVWMMHGRSKMSDWNSAQGKGAVLDH